MKKTLIITLCVMAWLFIGLYTIAHAAPNAGCEWTHDGVNTANYNLQYAKDSAFTAPTTLTFPANQRSTVIEGLDWETTYYFRITAVGPGGSTVSDTITAVTPEEPVGPPSKPVLKIQITSTAADGTITTFTLANVEAD